MKIVEVFFTNGESTEFSDAYYVHLYVDAVVEIRDNNTKDLIGTFNFDNIAGVKIYEV